MMGRNQKIVAMYREGYSGHEVARAFGLTGQRVYRILADCGEPRQWQRKAPRRKQAPRPPRNETERETCAMVAFDSGMTYSQIAKAMGITRNAVAGLIGRARRVRWAKEDHA
jgi:transposase